MTQRSITREAIGIALAVDIILTCFEGSVHSLSGYLPIGNSHLAQIGFLLGMAVAIDHMYSSIRRRS